MKTRTTMDQSMISFTSRLIYTSRHQIFKTSLAMINSFLKRTSNTSMSHQKVTRHKEAEAFLIESKSQSMNANQRKPVSKNQFTRKLDMIARTYTTCLIRGSLKQNNKDRLSKLKLIRSYNRIVTRMMRGGFRN